MGGRAAATHVWCGWAAGATTTHSSVGTGKTLCLGVLLLSPYLQNRPPTKKGLPKGGTPFFGNPVGWVGPYTLSASRKTRV